MSLPQTIFSEIDDTLTPVYDVGKLSEELILTIQGPDSSLPATRMFNQEGVAASVGGGHALIPIQFTRFINATSEQINVGQSQFYDFLFDRPQWLYKLFYELIYPNNATAWSHDLIISLIRPNGTTKEIVRRNLSFTADAANFSISWGIINIQELAAEGAILRMTITGTGATPTFLYNFNNNHVTSIRLNIKPHVNYSDNIFGTQRS